MERGSWDRSRSHPFQARWAGFWHGAGLPMLSHRGHIEAQQSVSLPAAQLHGNIQEVTHKCRRVLVEVELQQLDQELFLQCKQAQGLPDCVLQDECLWMPSPEDAPQLLAHPVEQQLEQSRVPPEKLAPDIRGEATHQRPGCLGRGSVGGCCLRRADDKLLELVISLHRVHN